MDISVIIPSYNNAAMLETTLSAFKRVRISQKTEIIVVDNNSTDDTAEIIKTFSDQLPIIYVFESVQGISAAKNAGIGAARGTLLVFTDDDVRPNVEWLTAYWAAYKKDPEGVFWGGAIVSEFEGSVPKENLLRVAPPSVRGLDYGIETRSLKEQEWLLGANMAFTSKAIKKIGGFDTSLGLGAMSNTVLGGEETELQRRLKLVGYRGMYLPNASIRHVVPSSKCTLEHVAVRAEALGRYLREINPPEKGPGTFHGAPLWRYRRCIDRYLRAWSKRISGRDWYPDYITYRIDKGFLLGIPESPDRAKSYSKP